MRLIGRKVNKNKINLTVRQTGKKIERVKKVKQTRRECKSETDEKEK